ncbi:MAG: GtrA family protein [Anaerolineaceae bacterium]
MDDSLPRRLAGPSGANGVAVRRRRFSIGRGLKPLRFAAFGGFCAVLQLGLLALFTESTVLGTSSNALAFLISAEVNFVLNYWLTWTGDGHSHTRPLWVQFLSFNALVAVAAAANQFIFVLVERELPYLVAGAVGIGATTLVKYVIADKWIFGRSDRRASQRKDTGVTAPSPE